MCMCPCVYAYMCVCVHVCMRACVYVCMCVHHVVILCVCLCVCVYVYFRVLQTKYSKRIYKLFHECFKWFPIATIVNEETVVLHGGISMQPGVTMEDLNAIPRHECKMNE